MEIFERLAVALALGLLIGLERGWEERAAAEGTRVAGIRTFALTAILGALWAILAQDLGPDLLGFAFLAFSALLISAHWIVARRGGDYGITTVVAALITFVLGALAARGEMVVAAAAAVVTTILLGLKPVLHGWLRHLQRVELFATFKLLLISVVMLPLLPNRGYGPWQVLNPYQIWWWVVLIAAIGFVGYFAIRFLGTRLGILLTALFGGLASSTAVTLNLSRIGHRDARIHSLLAAGVVAAAATMFPRVLLEVSVVNSAILPQVLWPLLAMTAVSYLSVPLLWRSGRRSQPPQDLGLSNPFELLPALQFGALLVAIMLLSRAFQEWFGDAGIYLLAGFSGLSDVDAITLSLSRLAHHELAPQVASRGIVIAAMVNTATKGALVAFIAGGRMAIRVGLAFSVAVFCGALVLLFA